MICFGSGGDGPCSRTQDAPVTFPTTGTYSKILLHLTLTCPKGGCDPWDRMGSIDLVTTAGDAGAPDASPLETLTELGRFITPFGITPGTNAPPVWDIDVTDDDSVEAAMGVINQQEGRLDVLVNNAGISASAEVDRTWRKPKLCSIMRARSRSLAGPWPTR